MSLSAPLTGPVPNRVKSLVYDVVWEYHAATSPSGDNLLDEDWDHLVILDGCRYDVFKQLNTIDGSLDFRHSVGSNTNEFLEKTFDDRRADDVVYVTANPMHLVEEWCSVNLSVAVHDVVDVWRTDWDDELGTVPPTAMTDAVLRARQQYPDRRLLCHYVQPHYPFIGPLGRGIPHRGMVESTGEGTVDGSTAPNVWERLQDGQLDRDTVWQAYKENLELVLPEVKRLLNQLSGRLVVTADHGNHAGEFAFPFPVRIYGHPEGLRTAALVKVPWLVVEN
jgi:hypothetical protein